MSSWREVLIRILALLQTKTLPETKNRTLKCLKRHYSTVRSMKSERAGHLHSFFVSTPGDLTAHESPPSGICHPRPKKCYSPGVSPGRGGWAQLEMSDALYNKKS